MSVESLVSAAVAAALSVAATLTGAGPVPAAGPAPGGGHTGSSGVTAAVAPAATSWGWPLDPRPSVLAGFDAPDEKWGRGHRGVDLGAAVGRRVLAPTDGRIAFAGMIAGRGIVVVAHDGGLRSTFEPVRNQAVVGSAVRAGEAVAVLADTPGHCGPASCLHWGVLRGDTYLNPLSFLTRRPIVLLPLQ